MALPNASKSIDRSLSQKEDNSNTVKETTYYKGVINLLNHWKQGVHSYFVLYSTVQNSTGTLFLKKKVCSCSSSSSLCRLKSVIFITITVLPQILKGGCSHWDNRGPSCSIILLLNNNRWSQYAATGLVARAADPTKINRRKKPSANEGRKKHLGHTSHFPGGELNFPQNWRYNYPDVNHSQLTRGAWPFLFSSSWEDFIFLTATVRQGGRMFSL